MNVLKVIVDELPENCFECDLVTTIATYTEGKIYLCTVRNRQRVGATGKRPVLCPLVKDDSHE